MSKNKYPYPCTDCLHRQPCYEMCNDYKEWLKEEWNIVTAPFREIKLKRDERKGNETSDVRQRESKD